MIRKIIRAFLFLLFGILVVILGLFLILIIKSPGKAEPILDLKGEKLPKSISSIEKVILGGQEQYLIIRGADSTKQVMLFLHGGPGHPELFFMKNANQAIEKDFVMVYWEQRGAGKSFSENIPVKSFNISQYISDTKELSEMLAKRFKKKKIFLMGHSWGSLLGILTASKYPGLYDAYFGIGQVGHIYKSEKVTFDWVKEQASMLQNREAINALNQITYPDSSASWEAWMNFLKVERKYLEEFGGGVTHHKTSTWHDLKMVLDLQEYTIEEKKSFIQGSMFFSLYYLFPEVLNKNLFNEIDSVQIPVYIFHGKYDYQTALPVAIQFFNHIKAPEKQLFVFEHSAHSPNFEEVDRFNYIIKEKAAKFK